MADSAEVNKVEINSQPDVAQERIEPTIGSHPLEELLQEELLQAFGITQDELDDQRESNELDRARRISEEQDVDLLHNHEPSDLDATPQIEQIPLDAYEGVMGDHDNHGDVDHDNFDPFNADADSSPNLQQPFDSLFEHSDTRVDQPADEQPVNHVEPTAAVAAPEAPAASPAPSSAPVAKEPKAGASGKLINPAEYLQIKDELDGLDTITEAKLIAMLDQQLGRERTDNFMAAIDRYLSANPNNVSQIPVDFVMKRLESLSSKTFEKGKVSDIGLTDKALNIDDDSALSVASEVKNTAPSPSKNESQMNNRDLGMARQASQEGTVENNGAKATGISALMMRFGGNKKSEAPTIQSLSGADSSLKPTDGFNSSYSQDARRKYVSALDEQLKNFFDLSSAVEKNNTPKNRRELFRSMDQLNENVEKGRELMKDPSSFSDPETLKKFLGNVKAVRSKMTDLKKAKIIPEDDMTFKSLYETLKNIIVSTLQGIAQHFKLGAKKGVERDTGPSM